MLYWVLTVQKKQCVTCDSNYNHTNVGPINLYGKYNNLLTNQNFNWPVFQNCAFYRGLLRIYKQTSQIHLPNFDLYLLQTIHQWAMWNPVIGPNKLWSQHYIVSQVLGWQTLQHYYSFMFYLELPSAIIGCDMAFIEPVKCNKPNIT